MYTQGDSTFHEATNQLVFVKTKIDGKKQQVLNLDYIYAGALQIM